MTMTDPIADMLTRIRNAIVVKNDYVNIPASKMKTAIAKVLKEEGFISEYETFEEGPRRFIRIHLSYTHKREPILNGLKRVSRPGLRVYVQKREIPRVYNGLGIAILSTPKGIMAGQQAWRLQTGGELLCYVW
jgi:small subunit ribosomal protein S8